MYFFYKGILGNKRYYKSKPSHRHKQKALSIIVLPNLIAAKQRALGILKRKQISDFLPAWKQQKLGFEM